MRIASACTTCFTYVNAQCVLYDGPILQTLNITETTNLEDILITIDQYLSNLNGAGGDTIVQEGTFITILGDGSPGNPYIVNNSMTNTSSLINDGQDGLNPFLTYSDIYQSPRLIEGNWSLDSLSGDYTYNVFVQRFILNNITYVDVGLYDQITLADADPTLDRIDIIYIDNNLQLGVSSSTPAINPTTPFIDTETQLPLFQVLVEAGTQAPSGVTNLLVYDEDTGSPSEFDIISSSSSINPADTSDPVGGSTYDILFNNPQNGDKIEFRTLTDLINANNTANLIFRIKTPSEVRFNVFLEDANGANRSNQVQVRDGRYGYNSSVTDYQTIAIPLSALQRNNDSYSTLVFRVRQSFSGLWTMDRVLFQAGISTPQSEQVTRTSQLVNDGENSESPLKFILEAPSGGPFVRQNNEWIPLSTVYPSLDEVLNIGNTSELSINLNSDTSEVNITGLGSNSILSGKGLTIDGEDNLSINKDGLFVYELGNLKAGLGKENNKGFLSLGNNTGLYTSKLFQNEFVSANREYFLPNRSGNLAMSATNGSFTIEADDFGVLDISPLLVSSGIGEQNNINTVFTFPVGLNFSINNLLSIINNASLFTVSDVMNVFFEFTGLDQNFTPINEIWILTNVGKGNYGAGSVNTITEVQIKKISTDSTTVSNIINDANTQVITLSDLNGADIDVLFNATDLTSQNPVQNQEEGYVIINTTNAGDAVQYLFVGEGGIYGSVGGLDTASLSDFILLTNIEENSTTQIIDLGEIGSSNVEDIFNNTDLSPSGSNSNPIQDQSNGYVVVKTKNNGVDVDYLFVGVPGDYGNINASLIATDVDFLPFSPYVEDVDPVNLTWQRATSIGGANSFTEKVITGEANTYTNVILHNGPVMATDFVVSENGAIRNKVVNGGFVGLKIIGNNDVFISGANNNNADIVLGSLAGNQTAWSSTTKTTVHTRRRYVVDPILGTNTSFKRVYGFEARDIVNFDTATNSSNYYASFVSNPEIEGTVLSAAPENIFALRGRGRVLLEDYGSGNVTDEIPAYSLAVSASGRIVEIDLGGNIGVDPNAIHNNIANEFTIIPEETSPNLDSYLLLEDEIGLKKKVKLSNISSGSSSTSTLQQVLDTGNISTTNAQFLDDAKLQLTSDSTFSTYNSSFENILEAKKIDGSASYVSGIVGSTKLEQLTNSTQRGIGVTGFSEISGNTDGGRGYGLYGKVKNNSNASVPNRLVGSYSEVEYEHPVGANTSVNRLTANDSYIVIDTFVTPAKVENVYGYFNEIWNRGNTNEINRIVGINTVIRTNGGTNLDVVGESITFQNNLGGKWESGAFISFEKSTLDIAYVQNQPNWYALKSQIDIQSVFSGTIQAKSFLISSDDNDPFDGSNGFYATLNSGTLTGLRNYTFQDADGTVAFLSDVGVQSIVAGTNITVDNTDPNNPIISASSSGSVTLQEVIAEGNSSTLPIIIDNKNTTPTQFFGSALLTVESLMDVNGTSVGAALDHYRNPTADSSGSDIYATFNRLVSDSDFRDGRLQAFYSQAKYQGTAGLDTSMYGGRLESVFEGSGGMGSGIGSSDGFLIGVRGYTANKAIDNSNINYIRAYDSEAVMDSTNGTVDYLQGHHNNVTLIKGTVNNDVSINYLDFDYTTGTVNGDLAYITAKDSAIDFSFVNGNARFIDSEVSLPSRFGGSIETTELIVTGKTNDDVLLGDGSTTSLASIGGGIQSIVGGTNVTIDNTDPNNPIINASGSTSTFQSIYDADETGITSTDTFGNFSLDLERGGTGLQAKLNDVTYSFDFIAKPYMTSILDINETNSKIEFKQHSGLNVRGVSMSVSSISNSPYLEFKSSIDGAVAGGSLIFSERLQSLKNTSNAPATPTFYTAWQANGDAFLLGDPLGNSEFGGHLLINGFGASLMQGAGTGNTRDSERRFLPTAFYDGTSHIHANDNAVTAGLPDHLGVVRLDLLNFGGGGATPTLQQVVDASPDGYNSVYTFPNFNSRFIIDANDEFDANTRFGWNINEFDASKGNTVFLGTAGGNQSQYNYDDFSGNTGSSSINVMNGDSVNFDTKSAVVEITANNSDWTNIDSIIVGGIPGQALNHGINIKSDYINLETPDFGKGKIFVSTDGTSPTNSSGSGVVSVTSSNAVLVGQINNVSTDVFIQVDNSSKEVFIYNLPTSLPSAPNSIWNDGGTLKIT